MQQSNLTAFQMIRMHRGAHYGPALVKEPRMDTLRFLFICPSARAVLRVHTAHLLLNTRQSCREKVSICGSPLAWSWETGGTVTSEGHQLCSPSEQMNGGRPRHHLSIGGDLRLSGGHLIALSRWLEIKKVLLCLWFCRDLKPRPGGEQFTAARL